MRPDHTNIEAVNRFHTADRRGKKAAWARAYNAGIVLDLFKPYPGEGLQRGGWAERDDYPLPFVTMCSEANRDKKAVARDAQAYWHYYLLSGWHRDHPLGVPEHHPARLRRCGLSLSHFRTMRELGRKWQLNEKEQLEYLADAVEANAGHHSMRANVNEDQESNGDHPPDPLPKVWARAILPKLAHLAETDFDNHPRVRAWAREGLRLLGETWGL